jgi:hypothetical protein
VHKTSENMNIPNQMVWSRGGAASKIDLRSILRLNMPFTVLLFCAAFNWSYVKWISPVWGYGGLTYKSPDPLLLIFGYVLAAVVCASSPLTIRRPSQVIYWILYFTVYIPGLFVPLFLQLDNGLTLLLIQLSMAGGMLLIALSYRMPLLTLQRYPVSPKLFWTVFSIVLVLCNAILLFAFRNNLHLASLEQVYAVRFHSRQVAESYSGINYISNVLSFVINPFILAYGLCRRQGKLIALGIIGQIIVYSTAAAKSVLLSPLLIVAFYYSLRKDRGDWAPKMGLLCTGLFFFLTTLQTGANPGILFNLATVTLVRSFAMPGSFIGQYQYFFENFPHTYLGHVTGINLLIHSPYQLSTGMEIGNFYSGSSGEFGPEQENASFFAFDGIAGFGLPGIPIMCIICAAMFWLLDSCAGKYPIKYSAPALTMCTISLTNSSLFSTLLGNGLLVWMMLFILMPRNFLREDSRSLLKNC